MRCNRSIEETIKVEMDITQQIIPPDIFLLSLKNIGELKC